MLDHSDVHVTILKLEIEKNAGSWRVTMSFHTVFLYTITCVKAWRILFHVII